MIDERPPEVCLRCGTLLSDAGSTLQCALSDEDGRLEAWCAAGTLHVADPTADERRMQFLVKAVSEQGLNAELCPEPSGGETCL